MIKCLCFHLQTQNILLSDTCVRHLMYVFSFLFQNRKPVWCGQACFFFFFFQTKKLSSCRTGRWVAQDLRRLEEENRPEPQCRRPTPCSSQYPTLSSYLVARCPHGVWILWVCAGFQNGCKATTSRKPSLMAPVNFDLSQFGFALCFLHT